MGIYGRRSLATVIPPFGCPRGVAKTVDEHVHLVLLHAQTVRDIDGTLASNQTVVNLARERALARDAPAVRIAPTSNLNHRACLAFPYRSSSVLLTPTISARRSRTSLLDCRKSSFDIRPVPCIFCDLAVRTTSAGPRTIISQ